MAAERRTSGLGSTRTAPPGTRSTIYAPGFTEDMDTELAYYIRCQSAWEDIATTDPSRPPYQYDSDANDFGKIHQSDGTEIFYSRT